MAEAADAVLQGQALDARAQPLGHLLRAGLVGIGQHHGQLFPAIARRHVAGPLYRLGQRAAHGLQAGIARHMAVGIVVALEVVQVDQQQRQRRALARSATGLALQHLVKAAAVGQARQLVLGGQHLQPAIGVQQFLARADQGALGARTQPHRGRQAPADQRNRQKQPQHHGQRQQRLPPPGAQCLIAAQGHRGHQRIALAAQKGVDSFRAVQQGAERRRARHRPHVVAQEIGRLREVPPQVLLAERVAHQQLPARRAQCNGPLLADIDLAEQPQEILHPQRHHHRACKLSLGVRIAPADGDDPFAGGAAADRRPDVDA